MPPEREPNRYEALRQAEQAQPAAPAEPQTGTAKEEAQPEQQGATWQDRYEAAVVAKDQTLAEMRAGNRHSPCEIGHAEVQMDNELAVKLKNGGFDRDPAAPANPETQKQPEAQRAGEDDREQSDAQMAKAQRLAEAARAREAQQADRVKERETAEIER